MPWTRVVPMKRFVLLLLMMAPMGACTRWVPVTSPEPSAEAARTIPRARVTPVEGEPMLLRDVRVTADSVVGWRPLPTGRERIALHRDQVRLVEEQRESATLPWVFLAVLAAIVLFPLTMINRGV